MSAWLHKKRKGELQELAQQSNLPNSEGLLKDDLITALESHLSKNESTYGKKSAFSDFYKRAGSPVKRERPSPAEAGTVVVSKPRRRQTKVFDQEDSQGESTPQKALVARTPRTVSRVASQIDIPASPAQLANVAEQQLTAAGKKAHEMWEKTKIEEAIEWLRENFSSVVAVQSSVLFIEAFSLQYKTLEWAHAANIPAIKTLYLSSHKLYLPDIRLLLTSDFWAPATLWALTSLFLPLVASYFVNLTLRSNTRHRSNKGSYVADPLTFNVVKALLAYVVYPVVLMKDETFSPALFKEHYPSWGPFSVDTVSTVRNSVPGQYPGLLIGAGVGILASIYDAALKK